MSDLADLSQLSDQQKDELIRQLWPLRQQVLDLSSQVLGLQGIIKALEGRLSLNSRNSSRPPSSDALAKPAPKSLRESGHKKSGGQIGHPGSTLRQRQQADEIVDHHGARYCGACQLPLPHGEVVATRQVWELPTLSLRVIEHRQMRSVCACGAAELGAWPEGVVAPVQYGASVKAAAVHLNQHHLIPLARTAALMKDLYALSLSQASIQRFAQQAARALAPTVQAIGQAVQAAAVAHADETGIRVKGALHWLHCAVTGRLTWLGVHERRGTQAIEALGLLQEFQGVLVHDGLASYKALDCTHSLCNAHHIRELVYAHEQSADKAWNGWAQEMIELLVQALREVDARGGPLDEQRQAWFDARWDELLQWGQAMHPPRQRAGPEQDECAARGRIKQSKETNLLKRLDQHRQDVWRFMRQENVPFTNNLAEQALRMAKVRQKVSGCFRTEHGPHTFSTIRSYLATMHKQGANLFECLLGVFRAQTIAPDFAA